jgi:Amt family ammonium transporter
VYQIWREERKKGFRESPSVQISLNPHMLTLSILLLWIGWFGFNPGSVLTIGYGAEVVVLTTFLSAASALMSTMLFRYLMTKENPGLLYAVNGVLMGLIVITPLAGFVGPGIAVVLGFLGGPIFLGAERWFSRFKWFSDPVGLFPGHMVGGLFGTVMIAFLQGRPLLRPLVFQHSQRDSSSEEATPPSNSLEQNCLVSQSSWLLSSLYPGYVCGC